MDEILEPEKRDELIERFTSTAKLNVLTNMDALMVMEILKTACQRASASMEEDFLQRLIDGEDFEE